MNREPLYFSDDSHLAELFREAEAKRKPWKNVLQIAGAWIGLFVASGVIWWGVLRAIGAL